MEKPDPCPREPHTWGAWPGHSRGGAHTKDSLTTGLPEESRLGIQKSNVSIMAQSEKIQVWTLKALI